MPSLPGVLRTLANTPSQDGGYDLDILLIAGISTPSPDSWVFASSDWLSSVLPQNLRKARILVFDYTISLTDSDFTCQDFLLQGDVLLSALSRSRSQCENRPLFSVCHSVGGLVLKQALCIAREQPYQHGSILNSVAGIIFMGTPHSASTDGESLSRLLTLLAKTNGIKRINVPEERIAYEQVMLGRLATRFESIDLRPSVLTIWETEKTRVSEGLLKSRMVLLTEKRLCAVHSPMERFLPLSLNHGSLCRVELADNNSQSQIRNFVRDSLNRAPELLAARLEAMEFRAATTASYSPIDTDYLSLPPIRDLPPVSTLTAVAGSAEHDFEIIPRLIQDKAHKRPKPKLPCFYLNSQERGRFFHGRQTILDLIQDALLPSEKTDGLYLKQFALCGLGGVGKTEIAMEFALRFKDSFDAIFWVHADETAKMDKCFQDISVKLDLEAADEAHSQIVSRSLLKGWLASPTKNDIDTDVDINPVTSTDKDLTWLMIFDNADDPKLLGDYWPDGSGSVLITSRDPLAKRLFSIQSSGIDLKPLSDSEGGSLLMRLTDSDESPEDDAESTARQISQDLGGLPLAITQMAGYIRRNDLSLSEFLSLYQEAEERTALFGSRFDTGTGVYHHSIATVWALEKLSKEAKVLLQTASLLDPDIIQESILLDACMALLGEKTFSKAQFNNTRAELLQVSLFKRDKGKNDLSEYRVSVHRLVQDAVLANMATAEMDSTVAILVDILWKNWPSAMGPSTKPVPFLRKDLSNQRYMVNRYSQCAALYPHLISLKQRWKLTSNLTDQAKLQFAADFDGFWDFAESLCKETDGDARDAVLVDIHYCLGLTSSGNNNIVKARIHQEAFFTLQKRICESIAPDFVDEKLGLAYAELGLASVPHRQNNTR
ncbi:tetratricopeptide repeat domain-containing protein [Xylaria longipes]|nr:tetratricopeptide repeat domain-containing protein [Xylaria longipes]